MMRALRQPPVARVRFGAALLLGAAALLMAATPAFAQTDGACVILIDGRSLGEADAPERAIGIDADGVASIVGLSSVPVTRTTVSINVWPTSWTIADETVAPSTEWVGQLRIADYSRLGSGLYQVTAASDVCQVHGWVNVTGRSALGTPLGIASVGIVVIGLLMALRALVTAGRGNGLLAVAGGVVTGIGALLFAQQSGIAGITPTSAVLWTALPGTISGVLNRVVSAGGTVAGSAGGAVGAPGGSPGTGGPPIGSPGTGGPPIGSPGGTPVTGSTAGGVVLGSGTTTVSGGGPGGGGGGGTVVATEPDPPRTTYARLSCPDAVVAQQPFDLVVGLAARPDARVAGEALHRPASSVGAYTMTIQLVADGLQLAAADATWRLDLPVTADEPYPFVTIRLVPDAQGEPVRASSVRAMYSIDGNPIGLAVRSVAIVRSVDLLETAPSEASAPGVDLSLPAGQVAPDLTVRIERAESQSSGRLLVQLLAADPTIDTPDAPIVIDIGADPAADLRRIVEEMHEVEGRPTQFVALRGIGLTIAEQLPIEFWDVLARVAARIGDRPPTILFLSAEPYVPWELAVVDPPLDPDLPPFLAAQATVGRWVLGQRRPSLPPPMTVPVHGVAAVSGIYELPGWERLTDAEAEAADIVRAYGATAVDATIEGILGLLKGSPPAEIIHFAVHGNYDAEQAQDGLILVDGSALDPLAVKGIVLHGHPFVFLNACQVGRGNQLLGDHAGLAAAFLFAGASGVIAPLWSIDDGLARDIAIRFYERAMRGEAPAEIMRTERGAFRDADETTSSTYLAYQFFGHPGLRFEPEAGEPSAPV